jgi:hypothetical protein
MTEIAWREDMRRQSAKSQLERLGRLFFSFDGVSSFVNYGRAARKKLLERKRNGNPVKDAIAMAALESGARYIEDLASANVNHPSKPDDGFEDVPY